MAADETLDDLTVDEVFARRLAAHEVPADQQVGLAAVFREAVLALHEEDLRGTDENFALVFQNLNSLAGEWAIDFTHPDYVSSGIFAITGSTGAGKTTILDAICLSLYGQTLALPGSPKTITKSCRGKRANVLPRSNLKRPRRFRCHWSQHRSRKRADGPLAVTETRDR
ncbi:MAG: AAA family ATPase [Desulfobacterales bacterium]|nr:AAA family ATPase [Desulfobacterales bacterium]